MAYGNHSMMRTLATRARQLGATMRTEEAFVEGKLTRTALISLSILTFITFIGNFTQLQTTAALPTIDAEFHTNITIGQWLTSIFPLIMGVMIPLTAFLTRRFTTRQIVITSMLVFTAGSLVAWLGTSFLAVFIGRVLEAMGTGVMWPVLQITVFSIYPLAKRGLAMGSVGMAMSVAPALGPTIGGWQTDASGWRSIFLWMSVIGIASSALAFVGLKNYGGNDASAKADFFSVALSIIGFGGVMFGFTNIEAYPITNLLVWAPMVIGAAGIAWFVLRQIRIGRAFSKLAKEVRRSKKAAQAWQSAHPNAIAAPVAVLPSVSSLAERIRAAEPPLLNLSVLRNKSFTIGTIAASLTFFAFSSIMVIIPLYIQNDRGFNATMSGLILLPGAFGQCIAQFYGGKMLDRLGARPVALVGSSILFFGTVMMSLIDAHTWIWWISIWQFTRQIGMGFVIMPITTWSLNCLDSTEVSAGSAVTNTIRQIAGAIGAPVLVILMTVFAQLRLQALGGGAQFAAQASIFGVQWTLRISAAITFAQVLIVLFGVKGDGAGSTRDVTRRALERWHLDQLHAPRLAHVPHLHAAHTTHNGK